MKLVTTRDDLRRALAGVRPGLTPTMGALHAGHESLIQRAAQENAATVVSIFVNPTQFDRPDDLTRYRRDLDRDLERAGRFGATIAFAPPVTEVYPPGFETSVVIGRLANRWEGAARPNHFQGVATVVTILLNLVQPARTYFGEKDYQQLQVIRKVHRDLALPGEIVGCPTVRDPDGVALSSRNAFLSDGERALARSIPVAIEAMTDAVAAGELSVARLEQIGLGVLNRPGIAVDYLAIVDPCSLEPMPRLEQAARVLIAASIGDVRLIDNERLLPRSLIVADADAESG